ncbi:MAG: class D sortase [Candidatus Acidiferrales bacterium]
MLGGKQNGRREAFELWEAGLLVVALMLLGAFAEHQILPRIETSSALAQFADRQARRANVETESAGAPEAPLRPRSRIQADRRSLQRMPLPIAVLKIPKIGLEVPVFEGTDDATLDRGTGRILGTARPGEPGNIGIAGHRNTFFRGLKEIGPGDALELVTHGEVHTFLVERTEIVFPENTSVLQPREFSAVTLVTCYPFYFLGNAPQRFVVTARLWKRTGLAQ